MTTCLANEIQQSSLTMFHPTYVSPVCRDVWEAQVWFYPSDSPLERMGSVREGVVLLVECKWRNIIRKYIKPGILEDSTIPSHNVHATEQDFLKQYYYKDVFKQSSETSFWLLYNFFFFFLLNSCKSMRHVISFFWTASVLVFPHTTVKIFFNV